MPFESLASDALSKASSVDRWGFLPDAKCECGRKLGYKAPALEEQKNVEVDMPIMGGIVQTVVKKALVCRCGAVYTRGKNTT